MSEPEEYDAFLLRRPRKKRVSIVTGKSTNLNPETELQIQCVKWYRARTRLDRTFRELTRLYAVSPADGNLAPYLRDLQKRAGKVPGIYDLHFLDRRKGWQITWIEMKWGKNGLTPEQEGFAAWLSDTPIRTVECRSLSEFVEMIA